MLQCRSRTDAPGGVHEGGDGLVLESGDVLDGEVDDEADDAGEDADGEAEGPLEHHVPHLVALGPRPPVLVEQLVLDHPARVRHQAMQGCTAASGSQPGSPWTGIGNRTLEEEAKI